MDHQQGVEGLMLSGDDMAELRIPIQRVKYYTTPHQLLMKLSSIAGLCTVC